MEREIHESDEPEILSWSKVANELQKASSSHSENDIVKIEGTSEASEPESIIRMGREKVEYLIKGVAQLRQGQQTLEIFGGSGLSTALIGDIVGAKNLVTVDLHNQLSSRASWRYNVHDNYHANTRKSTHTIQSPAFIAADGAALPLKEGSFDVVLAPDPPRSSHQRFEQSNDSERPNVESDLSPEEQSALFIATAEEAYRVLRYDGVFAATAPLSLARQLHQLPFSQVQIFSSEDLGPDVTQVQLSHRTRFSTKNATDPVVYIRCKK